MVQLGNDWDTLLAQEFRSEYYLRLRAFLKREYTTRTIYQIGRASGRERVLPPV